MIFNLVFTAFVRRFVFGWLREAAFDARQSADRLWRRVKRRIREALELDH